MKPALSGWCIAILLLLAGPMLAQTTSPDVTERGLTETVPSDAAPPDSLPPDTGQSETPIVETAQGEVGAVDENVAELGTGPDYAAWERTASRSEAISELGRGSSFALERLRADLVAWRDQFQAEQSVNAARFRTVESQITALGPVPDDPQDEAPEVTERRVQLHEQLTRLKAPGLLALEAHARAEGLITEIDALIRQSRESTLLERGASPLDPRVWGDAAEAYMTRLDEFKNEAVAILSSGTRWQDFLTNIAESIGLLVVALALLLRGRTVVLAAQARVDAAQAATDGQLQIGQGAWRFLISLGQIALPLIGIYALQEGLEATTLIGLRGQIFVDALLMAGVYVVIGRWLGGQFETSSILGHSRPDIQLRYRARGRRYVSQIGWIMGVGVLATSFLSTGEASEAGWAVLFFPIQLALGYSLFRMGQVLMRAIPGGARSNQKEATGSEHSNVFWLVGRGAILVAFAGPILAALGYGAAANAIVLPTVMTLALLSVVVLLQSFVFDLYSLLTRSDGSGQDALAPVLIGFALSLVALPFVALIWGARVEDLMEVWARFREGYSLGETRVSPTDILTLLLVFGLGYMLTRLLQGALRNSILPRTRLDLGGRNAIVAGVGYMGIVLAALVAVRSTGLDLSSLAIVAGALSVGIGFGLQTIVSNFVSGIILLIERPVSEGDWIEVNGQMGYVRAISVRSTRIETFDRTDVIIPNADLVTGQVTNWTRGNLVGRVIIPVGVAYGTDTKRVEAILNEIAQDHPMVILTPPPSVLFMGFGADSLDFEIRAILRDINFMLVVKSDMNHAINTRFAAEGIEIPFAQRDIWLRNPEALRPPADPKQDPKEDPA